MNNRVSNEEFISNSEVTETNTKIKVPLPIILILCAIVVLSLIGMIRFPGVLKDYKAYKTAKERIQNGETSKALYDLYDLVEKYPYSLPIIIRTIEQSLENGYYDNAGYVHNTYMVGMGLSDSEYEWVNMYTSWLNKYYKTLDQIELIYNEAPLDEISGYPDYVYVSDGIKKLLNKEGYNQAIVNYYLGTIEGNTGNAGNAIEYLEKCYKTDPQCFDVRVQLATFYRRSGNYKKAKIYAKEALLKDKSDAGALRALAILDLLEGNPESALANAKLAYKSNADGIYVRETYIIALSFNGMKEDAELIINELTESGESIDDDTQKLLNGVITLEEYYVEG
jgi:tetratricopeptide (TPR) repeat protein